LRTRTSMMEPGRLSTTTMTPGRMGGNRWVPICRRRYR
jgi:hypothetical protein